MTSSDSFILELDREPWRRQPAEPHEAFLAFQVWRELDYVDRTPEKVIEVLDIDPDDEIFTPQRIANWQSYYRWDERAAAYVDQQDAKIEQSLLGRKLQARYAIANLGKELREKAAAALKELKPVVQVRVKNPETGEYELELRANLTPNEIIKLARVGVELEQEALGERQPGGGVQQFFQQNLAIALEDPQRLRALAQEILDAQTKAAAVTEKIMEGNFKVLEESEE